jgi:hypothetical protein
VSTRTSTSAAPQCPPLQAAQCPPRTGDSCSECLTSFSFLPGQYISSTAEMASPFFYRSEHWTSHIPRLIVVFFPFLPLPTKVNSSHVLVISCLPWQCLFYTILVISCLPWQCLFYAILPGCLVLNFLLQTFLFNLVSHFALSTRPKPEFGNIHISPLRTKRNPFYSKTQFVPRGKYLPVQLYKPVTECCVGQLFLRYIRTYKHITGRTQNFGISKLAVHTLTARL